MFNIFCELKSSLVCSKSVLLLTIRIACLCFCPSQIQTDKDLNILLYLLRLLECHFEHSKMKSFHQAILRIQRFNLFFLHCSFFAIKITLKFFICVIYKLSFQIQMFRISETSETSEKKAQKWLLKLNKKGYVLKSVINSLLSKKVCSRSSFCNKELIYRH